MTADDNQINRLRMVKSHIANRGISDERVLDAMKAVPRERFLPPDLADSAYEDRALPVGQGQTISQPYIVGLMSDLLRVESHHRVLEIGTGTGYQTAILAILAERVFTIERIEPLSLDAVDRITALGFDDRVDFRVGDGSLGWPEFAPFDRIMVTAGGPSVPQPLLDQLAEGGRLVVPVGPEGNQRLVAIERRHGSFVEHPSIAVRFVRLIGKEGFPD